MSIKGVSEWNDPVTINEDEFFLKRSDHAHLYREADQLHKKSLVGASEPNADVYQEVFPAPEEQLSPKGLALLSYLYSERDGSPAQPLVASVRGLRKITALIDDAPVGTSVTCIVQAIDPRSSPYGFVWQMTVGKLHKTVLKFERTEEGVRVINLDSTNNPEYGTACGTEIQNTLEMHAKEKNSAATQLYFYCSRAETGGRQKDEYQCGIFATKDARTLNKDQRFYEDQLKALEPIIRDSNPSEIKNMYWLGDEIKAYMYNLPPEYFVRSQSTDEFKDAVKKFNDPVVTKNGKKLSEFFQKYNKFYANHFSQEYAKRVKDFLKSGVSNERIKEVAELYDANNMTPERLVEVYGPHQAKKEAKTRVRPKVQASQRQDKGKEKESVQPQKRTPDKHDRPKRALPQPPTTASAKKTANRVQALASEYDKRQKPQSKEVHKGGDKSNVKPRPLPKKPTRNP